MVSICITPSLFSISFISRAKGNNQPCVNFNWTWQTLLTLQQKEIYAGIQNQLSENIDLQTATTIFIFKSNTHTFTWLLIFHIRAFLHYSIFLGIWEITKRICWFVIAIIFHIAIEGQIKTKAIIKNNHQSDRTQQRPAHYKSRMYYFMIESLST